jgi:hypothetical protein
MLTAVLLGVGHGVRHAVEPDHLAAVSVLVGDARDGRRGAWLGAIWGVGHTLSLAALGVTLAALGEALPAEAERVFRFLVGATLVGLGVRALYRERRHGRHPPVRGSLQALVVGAIHGLAGSGPLFALVFATLPTALERAISISLFGLGSVAGMAAASLLAGTWLQRLERSPVFRALLVAIAAWSIGLGLWTATGAVLGLHH